MSIYEVFYVLTDSVNDPRYSILNFDPLIIKINIRNNFHQDGITLLLSIRFPFYLTLDIMFDLR